MKTIAVFFQMQVLAFLILGPVAACFFPFDSTFWITVPTVGLIGTLLLIGFQNQSATLRCVKPLKLLVTREKPLKSAQYC